MLFKNAKLAQLAEFDEIIDVRTPSEFAEDHIPGAINCPVFSDEERATVGTMYKQVSPFEARKLGAALVSRNISHHLETVFYDKPKSWRPLIYCWRGGQRSGAMSIILSQVGWAAHKLEGGYKAYRRDVVEKLDTLSRRFSFRVICGPTGSGKSRLLAALAAQGRQVLDLETLAQHRGSVLGRLPDHPQPSQKWFDSLLLQTLQAFDPALPVYVEAESGKIGLVSLPAALFETMHGCECLMMDTPLDVRVAGLMEDYRHYVTDPQWIIADLQPLLRFHGAKQLQHWTKLIEAGETATMVGELLTLHYDPSYHRTSLRNYPKLPDARHITALDLSSESLKQVAATL
ncbi:MAG: tRNA 2-selenouridine(34) synthase MnmH [Gallionella sp.]|nr:tRNA 2-selenouridine(34) synthase MnmH [Gallionella sp.]MDD4945975.1 tRNA 2-selenouridine(34) synthase MnmH [Gallionella sp.]